MKEIYLNDEIYYRLRNIHVNAIGFEFGAITADLKKDEINEVDPKYFKRVFIILE